MSVFRIGEVDLDLQIVGAGVLHGALPPPELSHNWDFGAREMRDFFAFQEAGWRFRPQSDLDWSVIRQTNPDNVEAGLLAAHPWGGLVIIRDRVVVTSPISVGPPDAALGDVSELHPGAYLVHLRLPDSDLLGRIQQSLTALQAFDGGKTGIIAEPMLMYHLAVPAPTLDNASQWQWEQIGLTSAWGTAVTFGKRSDGIPIRVAVIDLGFDVHNTELIANVLWTRYVDYLGNVSNPYIRDNPHGTFCAGLIGARHNRIGVNGAAPECKLVLVALESVTTQVAVTEAIRVCWQGVSGQGDDGADVICSSLGVEDSSWTLSTGMKAAIDDAQVKGRNGLGTSIVWADFDSTLLINSGSLEDYAPIVCVAQCDQTDSAVHSGYGPGVDLVAPGQGVQGIVGLGTGAGSGCSYAAPCVAGVAALVLAVRPTLTWQQVTTVLTTSCIPPRNGPNDHEGFGRLDAYNAVVLAPNV
jgi:hypothetical protein